MKPGQVPAAFRAAQAVTSNAVIHRWVLDVGPLWPSDDHGTPSQDLTLTSAWQSGASVQETLSHLSGSEKAKILRFHFAKDAKLALGSVLLKRRAIVNLCHVPWEEAIVAEDANRKPCFKLEDSSDNALEFNISHHGSLVPLVACKEPSVKLGVDVVSIDWERSFTAVLKGGFAAWAHVYDAVFSDREVQDIIDFVPEGDIDDRARIMAKIRHFYAHWCCKEALVKMTVSRPWP